MGREREVSQRRGSLRGVIPYLFFTFPSSPCKALQLTCPRQRSQRALYLSKAPGKDYSCFTAMQHQQIHLAALILGGG